MSFQWRMCGIELHCDTNIGKHLSSLGQTLTALAGEPDVANIDSVTELQDRDQTPSTSVGGRDEVDNMASMVDGRKSKKIEKNMWEQARKVNELRLGSNLFYFIPFFDFTWLTVKFFFKRICAFGLCERTYRNN